MWGRFGAFVAWLSHFEPWLIATLGVVSLYIGFSATPGSYQSWFPTLFGVVVGLSMIGGYVHDRRWPCERCTERFPLDAPAEAARKRWALQFMHRSMKRTLLEIGIAYAIMVGTPFLLGIPLGYIGAIPWYILWVTASYARWQHNKLQPWCPWYRRRDEDDDPIVIPEPTPPSAKVDA